MTRLDYTKVWLASSSLNKQGITNFGLLVKTSASTIMIIYRTISFLQLILLFLFRLGYLTGASIALYHFQENPIVTIIVTAICLLFFILSGSDEIIVYKDIVEYKSRNILRVFRERKKFNMNDIKTFQAEGNYDIGSELRGFNNNPKNDTYNNIRIHFKDGSVTNFTTSIYIKKLKKAAFEIDKLIDNSK